MLFIGAALVASPALALKLDVRVQGLQGAQEANVLALLDIYRERDDAALTPSRVLALHRVAPDEIRDALAPFGLYRVEVKDDLQEPPGEEGTWTATYRVTPGEPVKVASVDYQVTGEGAEDPTFPKTFPMKVGDVLLHSSYEKAKSDIRYAASSEGFLDYELTRHQVLIDPVAYDAHIVFHIETGPQYRIGKVTFQQDLLDEDFLQGYVKVKSGDVYDPDRLMALQGRLLGSEYYKDVEIIPDKDAAGPDHEVPIEVIAKRNMANQYRIGLGYATNVGPRLTLDYRRRYLNRWGHKLRSELSLAPALSSLEIDYRIPIRDPTREYIIIKPTSSRYDTTTRKGWVNALQAAHSTVTPGGWRRNIGIDYLYDDLETSADSLGATNELVPNISWSKTVADDPINTNNGYRLKYSLLGTVQGLVSEVSYLSGQVQFKWVKRLSENYRFITRTDLGATWAESVDDLPASRRFYTGGDNSIRGWGFDVLGPNEPVTDDTVGGRYLAVGSLELERRIKGPWSAAVFTDFGNAFDPEYEQKFEQSVGVGLRWASPIGPVRIDVAFALTKDDGDYEGLPPARLHVVIGPDL
ncbi:outer membrane protein assembly factor [Thiorhodococcus mannitoliphagus]|uniref:Translocation and assembly module subunit TamA n=1 Tax=Thiorhodococcus mannitoliphagus TaxID=329406 RepID=A0A6P1DPA6_9GAMM|nr:autotransporter assembly complex family protein [Thiorhodococcus mannitoliphagus]NEX19818.1 outer membrane protein assembly factor [Thiorhodococcus mannitoliphagus]